MATTITDLDLAVSAQTRLIGALIMVYNLWMTVRHGEATSASPHAALVYIVGKESERSVIGGLNRPRPVMHATPGAGLRAMNGRRYTTGSTPLRIK